MSLPIAPAFIPNARNDDTWSSIKDIKGDTTIAQTLKFNSFNAITGSWKVKLLPGERVNELVSE